jgi:tetratricopeptide (TPR) repeat protein
MYLANLGGALQTRFQRTGHQPDLDEAITVDRDAVAATPTGHTARPRYLSNLCSSLRARFERTGQQPDLDEAIAVGRDAVAATPTSHTDQPKHLSNLANALRTRFERTGQQPDLDEAIAVGRDAVAATPTSHTDQPKHLSNLANALRTRFERTGQQPDLDEAIAVGRDAVAATPTDNPNRPMYLSNLGKALRTRFGRTGLHPDLDEAIAVCREGTGVVAGFPQWRMEAARDWGRCAVLAQDFGTAVEAYGKAIELLPLLVWHGLDQPTQEHHLRMWNQLASEAATAAIFAAVPARAVELVEAGRGMLWTQALHLRHDLTALQERDPGLAARLERARAILVRMPAHPGGGSDALAAGGDPDQIQAVERQMLEDRRRATREWDSTVDKVRQLEGFEDFLRPVPFIKLRAVAADGPVVILNVSPHGSHALIIAPDTQPTPDPDTTAGVQVVDLPDASWATVIDQANALLLAQRRVNDPTVDPATKEHDRIAVFDVLAWTWQAITEPALTALGHTTTPVEAAVEDWPRIWWCPTGPATVLPLHAAGMHPRTTIHYTRMGETAATADTVAGRVVSSYTPTLTALIRARVRPAPAPVRALAVGVPDAPTYVTGAGALPAVPRELQATAGGLPTPGQATYLIGSSATRDAVLDALPEHPWLHLSCHGVQHPVDATRSAFLLTDQPLTLADLTALNLPDADLAYLSACQTATGDIHLLDESLHLTAALQLIGYRHVLATLWSISDAAAPAMAATIYTHLAHADPKNPHPTDKPDSARAPYALHHAVARLRQLHPSEPLLWAPYIHLGP